MQNKIFIQIAAYRDPELLPTLRDCIANADHPENLVFSIAWQHSNEDAWDNLDEFKDDPRFKVLDINYKDSKGACWARNLLQQQYDREDYTLQLDSHHRFIKGWDTECINMILDLQSKGYPKPLLTGYISPYDPKNDPEGRTQVPYKMDFDRFIPEGAVFFLPATLEGWETMTEPARARFYSAHFCFTLGKFAEEVQHNPEYYFHGEEISVGVRAFTHGYDLFHPHKIIAWHEYTRQGRTKQWDDDKVWWEKNNKSHLTNRKLFGMDGLKQEGHDGKYGFGKERTLREYEEYAGLLFSKRSVQQATIDRKDPPNGGIAEFGSEEDWIDSFAMIFKHCIDIDYNLVKEKDYDFWVVAFHGKDGETIFRKDADKEEIHKIMNDPDGYGKVWREFPTTTQPTKWVVWPHSESKGWADQITGNL